jgi:hypothetical protein
VSKEIKTSSKLKIKPVQSFKGQSVQNFILRNLPPRERKTVFSKMEFVDLPIHTVLTEMFGLIKYGYFINSGLSSVLNVMSDGKQIEVGLNGQGGICRPAARSWLRNESDPNRYSNSGHRIPYFREQSERYFSHVSRPGQKLESICSRISLAADASGSLQPGSRRGTKIGTLVANESGPG